MSLKNKLNAWSAGILAACGAVLLILGVLIPSSAVATTTSILGALAFLAGCAVAAWVSDRQNSGE